jgi:bifunctional DNA-binding transcriptional regulator/antitoxin component of YhaV-PrlF toxin-antitoxin module
MKKSAHLSTDDSGNLVIPREICREIGLRPGTATLVSCRDGRIEIEPAPREVRIVRKGRLAVAVPVEPSEPLTAETVRRTQKAIRAERARL